MKQGKYLIVAAILIALLGTWINKASESEADTITAEAPAHVEAIEGSDLSRVILSQHAVERLDIQTADVVEKPVNGVVRSVAPYSSVLYDTAGNTWVFTNPEPLVFVRQAVTIESIEGAEAILTAGPDVGTKVVSVGGAMLYGAEHGVGH
jgi:hypothetical protein